MLRTIATHTLTRIARIHSHTNSSTVITKLCEARAQLLQNLKSNSFFWRYLREGEQTGVPRENPRQPARWSVSHIRGDNPTSQTGIEPSPSNIGDKLAWPGTHTAFDPLSYRPPQEEEEEDEEDEEEEDEEGEDDNKGRAYNGTTCRPKGWTMYALPLVSLWLQ